MNETKPIVIADPAPLGLAGFGITTCFLSLLNAGIIPGGTMTVVLSLAIAYGGGAQLLAGMWEFRKGNTFGATAFSSYGAFWLSFVWLVSHISDMGAAAGTGVGVYLLLWGVFTLYMLIGSLYLNKALFIIFLLLTITFFLLAIANLSGGSTHLGGWVGLFTGIAALYASAAGVINSTAGKTVWPLGSSVISK